MPKKQTDKPQVTLPEAKKALINAFSLCRKAGKLTLGFDACVEAAVSGKAAHLFYACDASKSTVERAAFETEELADLKELPVTQEELMEITPKKVVIFAVTDANLARLCEMKRIQCIDLISKEEVSE